MGLYLELFDRSNIADLVVKQCPPIRLGDADLGDIGGQENGCLDQHIVAANHENLQHFFAQQRTFAGESFLGEEQQFGIVLSFGIGFGSNIKRSLYVTLGVEEQLVKLG